ncbi:unnamed protein product [Litomosoides sigmodontis]|uniref:Uncharacterized protein n=1 Tax=Litomosoides sigmodontis TaxID=42156 RepID=A0A3P6SRJ6_LITSI|nr:unnamed protein product [Litomosoides sigmodontis]
MDEWTDEWTGWMDRMDGWTSCHITTLSAPITGKQMDEERKETSSPHRHRHRHCHQHSSRAAVAAAAAAAAGAAALHYPRR